MLKKISIPLQKLELGSGHRPTKGYLHNDVNAFKGIDIIGDPWEIHLPVGSLSEVIAIGLMEHLTFKQFEKTSKNMYRMLVKGGKFIFDVPDILVWSEYLYKVLRGQKVPFPKKHILATMYGWQRWPGDEHKSAWTQDSLFALLHKCGYKKVYNGDEEFLQRQELHRRRLFRPEDAHLRVIAVK